MPPSHYPSMHHKTHAYVHNNNHLFLKWIFSLFSFSKFVAQIKLFKQCITQFKIILLTENDWLKINSMIEFCQRIPFFLINKLTNQVKWVFWPERICWQWTIYVILNKFIRIIIQYPVVTARCFWVWKCVRNFLVLIWQPCLVWIYLASNHDHFVLYITSVPRSVAGIVALYIQCWLQFYIICPIWPISYHFTCDQSAFELQRKHTYPYKIKKFKNAKKHQINEYLSDIYEWKTTY